MTTQFENNQTAAGAGSFSLIEEKTWQPATKDGWQLPVIEQGIQSAARGALVIVAGITAATIGQGLVNGVFLTGMGASLALGVGAALYDFQRNVHVLFETYRIQELSTKRYEKESSSGAAHSESTVTIEVLKHKENGYIDIDRDLIHTDDDTLALACSLDALSKRALQSAGIGETRGMRLVSDLLTYGYLWRPAENEPAVWTLRGEALRHRIGGGVVVDAATTSDTTSATEG